MNLWIKRNYWFCYRLNRYSNEVGVLAYTAERRTVKWYYMASLFCIEQKRNVATGDIIVHISTENVGNSLVPVPPLAEQKRIVAKTEELLSHI